MIDDLEDLSIEVNAPKVEMGLTQRMREEELNNIDDLMEGIIEEDSEE